MLRRQRSSRPARTPPPYEEISAIATAFCQEHLTEEYSDLSDRLAKVVARDHGFLLAKGEPRSWAAAIVYALGKVNFLFDKSQQPHVSSAELCKRFGVSTANVSPKARQILEATGLFPLHPEWTISGLMEHNPLVWIIEVDGIPVDARTLPREIQEEAYRLGLIPDILDG